MSKIKDILSQKQDMSFKVIRAGKKGVTIPNTINPVQSKQGGDFGVNSLRFIQHWDLLDVLYNHAVVRASISMVGRTITSAWWSLVEADAFEGDSDIENKKLLYQFYNGYNAKNWNNVQDFYGTAYKFAIAAMYLRYFGQAAFYIVRDPVTNKPVSLDFLHGLVVPNVDSRGYFKNVAFIQYLDRTGTNVVEFRNPTDVVYIVNPDFTGSPLGGSDMASLSEYSLPIDLYLQLSAREYLKNRDKPEVVWELPNDISDEAFDSFCDMLEEGYRGPENIGSNPIAVAGELNIHELDRMPDKIPYQESREEVRKEILSAAGLTGYKLGYESSSSEATIKEYRREYSESTIVPLCKTIAEAFYSQIHVREFGIFDWEIVFNNSNFLTAVEQATVDMRYIQHGVLSPNEVRRDLGRREREGGNVYVDITDDPGDLEQNTQGSPPEGREARPDAPSETGEPSEESGRNDPERGDRGLSLKLELETWRRFVMNRIKKLSLIHI